MARTAITNRKAAYNNPSCLCFDGINDYVDFGTPSFAANNYTICFWFNTDALSATQDLFYYDDSINDDVFVFQLLASGKMYVHDNNLILTTNSVETFLAGKWYFVCFTAENLTRDTISNDNFKFYVNGAFDNQRTQNYSPAHITDEFIIGDSPAAPATNPFNGKIDELRIWDTVLTQPEIETLYYNNIVPQQNSLIAEYLFNETTGTTATDTSGSGNDGTITGATYSADTNVKARTAAGTRTVAGTRIVV